MRNWQFTHIITILKPFPFVFAFRAR